MRRLADRLLTAVLALAALAALGLVILAAGLVAAQGASAISLRFLTEQVRSVGADGGIFYQVVGTLILVLTACAVAVPLSAGTALTLVAFVTRPRLARALESVLAALNGIPSIVFGLFGLVFFCQLLGMKKSWLAGGLLLGFMIVPTVTVAFLEKLRAIPHRTIEGALGLGLSRSALVSTVLLPQAASGLFTGTLLGLVRAAGETAPIMFTAAIFAGATVPHGVRDSPVLALPYHIFVLAQDSFDPRVREKVWGTALVLIALVTILSLVALPLRMRAHEEARNA